MIEIAPIHFKQAVDGMSLSSFYVLHIFKDFIWTQFGFLSNHF